LVKKYPEAEGLRDRYDMDVDKWIKSKRGFPFNLNLLKILMFFFFIPLMFAFLSFRIKSWKLWKVLLTTLLMSLIAFFLSDSLIS